MNILTMTTSQKAEFLGATAMVGLAPFLINNTMDIIGDSRGADGQSSDTTSAGLTAVHFTNWSNARNGYRFRIGTNQSWAGARSDHYLKGLSYQGAQVRGGIDAILASPAAWVLFSFPIVNDLRDSAAGYTDTDGNQVTATNVADLSFARIKAAALRCIAVGKRCIMTPEVGATNLPATAIGQMHKFNSMLRHFVEQNDRLRTWTPQRALWSPTSSSNGIIMKPLVMRNPGTVDPTHYSVFGGRALSYEFDIVANEIFPPRNYFPMNINDNAANNQSQFTSNALWSRAVGDTLKPDPVAGKVSNGSGLVITSGTIPSGYEMKGNATSSVAITIADEPNGYGKQVTFAIAATAADSVSLIGNAPPLSLWNLTDKFQSQDDISVAAGSANAWTFSETQVNTIADGQSATNGYFSMFANGSYAPFPTDAYAFRFQSQEGEVKMGQNTTVKGYVSRRITTILTGAGNMTYTLSLPNFERW